MEAKRRRDARKIKDLQVSITPNRATEGPIVPLWDEALPEEVLSNSYIHCEDPKEFFEYLSGLIGNVYSGETVYDHTNATMICTIRKMEKSKSGADNGKSVEVSKDYKFEIALFASLQYATKQSEEDKKTNDDAEANKVDDEAEAADDKYHSNATNKENIFVVRCRRILGDDLQFRKLQKKVYLDGQQIFNGLPDWAMKMQKEDSFDKLLNNWDNQDDDEIDEKEYEGIEWAEEIVAQ